MTNESGASGAVVTVTEDEAGGTVHVAVVGELDMYSAAVLRGHLAQIDDMGSHTIVLDLSGVDFLDSAGIGVLVGALRRAEKRGGTVRVTGTRPNVRQVFDVTHLSQAFGMED